MSADVKIDGDALIRYVQFVEGEFRSFVDHVVDLLDVLTHLRQSNGEAGSWADGVLRRGTSMLLQHGIRPTAQIGQPLDLRFHEVVGIEPTEHRATDTIVSVVHMGYEMVVGSAHTIRAARVVIAGPQPAGGQHDEGQ